MTHSIPRPEQLARRDTERGAQSEDVHETSIPRAAFHVRDVVPMNAAQLRKLLLREAALLAELPQLHSEKTRVMDSARERFRHTKSVTDVAGCLALYE